MSSPNWLLAFYITILTVTLLMSIHFSYSIYVKHRTVSATVSIEVQNTSHFQVVAAIQMAIFLLFLTSSSISAVLSVTNTRSSCFALLSVAYCCWFIARYLCSIHFLFRLHVITKILAPKCTSLLLWLCGMMTITHCSLLTLFALNNHSVSDSESLSNSDCLSMSTLSHSPGQSTSDLIALSLNCCLLLWIGAMWALNLWRLCFLKTHSVHSIFATSYQSTANEEERTPIQSVTDRLETQRPDIVSQAVSATLNNADVTIGANRRKRNYTASGSTAPKPSKSSKHSPGAVNTKLVEMSDRLQSRYC